MKQLILMIFVLNISVIVYASDCRVVETNDKVEVVCEGKPEGIKPSTEKITEQKAADGLTKNQRDYLSNLALENINRLQRKIADTQREIDEQKDKPRREDDVKVTSISAMETERSYGYVTYSIKADVDNRGDRGNVFIKLVGKNRDGHQMDFVYLTANMDRKESRTLSTTTLLSFQKAMDLRDWIVGSINKY